MAVILPRVLQVRLFYDLPIVWRVGLEQLGVDLGTINVLIFCFTVPIVSENKGVLASDD